jgi:succinate dehydrogenase/fumarate reductase-like Fe-S protein
MSFLEEPYGIWSCKSPYRCILIYPKQIKITKAILKTKRKIKRELHQKEVKGDN